MLSGEAFEDIEKIEERDEQVSVLAGNIDNLEEIESENFSSNSSKDKTKLLPGISKCKQGGQRIFLSKLISQKKESQFKPKFIRSIYQSEVLNQADNLRKKFNRATRLKNKRKCKDITGHTKTKKLDLLSKIMRNKSRKPLTPNKKERSQLFEFQQSKNNFIQDYPSKPNRNISKLQRFKQMITKNSDPLMRVRPLKLTQKSKIFNPKESKIKKSIRRKKNLNKDKKWLLAKNYKNEKSNLKTSYRAWDLLQIKTPTRNFLNNTSKIKSKIKLKSYEVTHLSKNKKYEGWVSSFFPKPSTVSKKLKKGYDTFREKAKLLKKHMRPSKNRHKFSSLLPFQSLESKSLDNSKNEETKKNLLSKTEIDMFFDGTAEKETSIGKRNVFYNSNISSEVQERQASPQTIHIFNNQINNYDIKINQGVQTINRTFVNKQRPNLADENEPIPEKEEHEKNYKVLNSQNSSSEGKRLSPVETSSLESHHLNDFLLKVKTKKRNKIKNLSLNWQNVPFQLPSMKNLPGNCDSVNSHDDYTNKLATDTSPQRIKHGQAISPIHRNSNLYSLV